MNLKALITTLFVVGSSTAALAQPARIVEARQTPAAVVVQRTHEVAQKPVIIKHELAPVIIKHEPARVIVERKTAPIVIERTHAPVVVERTHAPVVVERTYAPAPIVEYRAPAWTLLSSSDQIAQNGRTKIELGGSELRTLELQSTSGKTTVSEVAIKFGNGETQLVYPQAALANGSAYSIDLNGNVRSVASIVVFGRSSHNASFEVLGA